MNGVIKINIAFVEIQNFRRLKSCRVDFNNNTTVFVGANNSGKTSAMLALKKFLKNKKLILEDFTISNWSKINEIGNKYINYDDSTAITNDDWLNILPSLDVWLNVHPGEIRYVANIIPTLDWDGGRIGIRILFEPKDVEKLFAGYRQAYALAQEKSEKLKLWPEDLCSFLRIKLDSYFAMNFYILDETKIKTPNEENIAYPQDTPYDMEPLEASPFDDIIKIDIISAQRSLEDTDSSNNERSEAGCSLLSSQLREYYDKQLDPEKTPTASDIKALSEIQNAKKVFDKHIANKFKKAIKELATFGYPGRSNPNISISTQTKTSDMLSHSTVVQYPLFQDETQEYKLSEKFNGLGYQNLISMAFKLMSFRDEWVNGNKTDVGSTDTPNKPIPPLHLVLIEEPEAHLHAQVQRVFIKNAYGILRNHARLKSKKDFSTQMIVSTHSSYIAHETNFEELRYFKRIRGTDDLPISAVVNMSDVFGDKTNETAKFVIRYLKTTHCDLFFADAVILIEGASEKILLPHFIENNFPILNQCYISILEINGSHAHRLKSLIERLGLLCLIITDLDAIDSITRKSALPNRGKGLVTNNTTICEWVPAENKIDVLLDMDFNRKVIENSSKRASFVRVAYQKPVKICILDGPETEVIPNTFEDALVYQNIRIFKSISGIGLIKKFRDIAKLDDAVEMQKKVFETLYEKNGKRVQKVNKAEFALDLLLNFPT